MRRLVVLPILLLLAGAAWSLDLTSYGLRTVSTATEGSRTVTTFQDSQGRSLVVSTLVDPPKEVTDRIFQLDRIVYGWRNIATSSIRMTVTDALIEATVTPSKVVVKGGDLLPYIPAGLFLTSTDTVAYDFRVTKDNLFLKIRGPYTNEDEMEAKMASAIADPNGFLLQSDPSYLIGRLEQAEGRIAVLEHAVQMLTQTLDDRMTSVNQAIDQANQASQAMADKQSALESAFASKSAEVDQKDADLSAAIDQANKDLAAQDQAISAALDIVRSATMTNQNVSWFVKHRLPQDGVAKVVELKKATPGMTRADVAKELKAAGIKMSDQEIRLVLEYYFNEF
ncbi:MAG TPA: hypothetical protein VFH83_00725 [Spirochaetia bacterium]|nr:hypothetical protein [Spirochaetia bacterium]